MRIIVDADSCPVKGIIEKIARAGGTPLFLFGSLNHQIHSEYATVITVDPDFQATDIALVNYVAAQDIVVTQDYGLASLVLAKGAAALHPSGKIFTEDNIEALLMNRYLNAKARSRGEKISKHKKRSPRDDICFADNLQRLIDEIKDIEVL